MSHLDHLQPLFHERHDVVRGTRIYKVPQHGEQRKRGQESFGMRGLHSFLRLRRCALGERCALGGSVRLPLAAPAWKRIGWRRLRPECARTPLAPTLPPAAALRSAASAVEAAAGSPLAALSSCCNRRSLPRLMEVRCAEAQHPGIVPFFTPPSS